MHDHPHENNHIYLITIAKTTINTSIKQHKSFCICEKKKKSILKGILTMNQYWYKTGMLLSRQNFLLCKNNIQSTPVITYCQGAIKYGTL